ncbi:hypothetical protein [Methylophilus sp. DW102]|uniref:hypothetical protein n=1 Tax=Methylophilus sp. DW102 TaxID=3095607 RepID=UPI003093A196|nr:hypothetical protein MTDW_26380 [Methylophilus sp. DW102]
MAQDFDIEDLMAEPPKKLKATKPVEIDINKPALSEACLPAITADVEVETERATFEATALVNQRIGRKAVIDAVTKLLTVTDLIDLQRIKESKSYKGAQVVVEGKLVTVTTWSDFCALVEDKSRESVDLEMANLDALGQPTFEALRKIGIGPSTMRSIRQLPDDDKALIEQVASTSNKDEVIDLIDGLVAKHQKQKAELNEKVAALEADLTQAGKRANNMDAEIERLTLTNERLVNKQRLTSFEPFTEDVRLECMHLQATIEVNFASLNKLFESVFFAEQSSDEQKLRVEQVYIAMQAALAAGVSWLNSIHEIYDEELAPKRIQAQHVLTPPEAERWLLEFESLKNAHNAAEAARQIARDKDKPRGRGRPAGSTNKGE